VRSLTTIAFLTAAFALAPAVLAASEPAAAPTCAFSPKEQALAQLLVAKPTQLRPALTCDPLLTTLARERAQDMAKRRYFRHDNPEGVGPNDFLRRRGFPLPGSYPNGRANTVEAIVGGYSDPREVWEELLGSAVHRPQVRGEEATFLEQDLFGIGYFKDWDTPQVDFWVVLIARRAAPDEPETLCSPPPSECFLAPKTKFVNTSSTH
jgi:uncharacterized protein YkwD